MGIMAATKAKHPTTSTTTDSKKKKEVLPKPKEKEPEPVKVVEKEKEVLTGVSYVPPMTPQVPNGQTLADVLKKAETMVKANAKEIAAAAVAEIDDKGRPIVHDDPNVFLETLPHSWKNLNFDKSDPLNEDPTVNSFFTHLKQFDRFGSTTEKATRIQSFWNRNTAHPRPLSHSQLDKDVHECRGYVVGCAMVPNQPKLEPSGNWAPEMGAEADSQGIYCTIDPTRTKQSLWFDGIAYNPKFADPTDSAQPPRDRAYVQMKNKMQHIFEWFGHRAYNDPKFAGCKLRLMFEESEEKLKTAYMDHIKKTNANRVKKNQPELTPLEKEEQFYISYSIDQEEVEKKNEERKAKGSPIMTLAEVSEGAKKFRWLTLFLSKAKPLMQCKPDRDNKTILVPHTEGLSMQANRYYRKKPDGKGTPAKGRGRGRGRGRGGGRGRGRGAKIGAVPSLPPAAAAAAAAATKKVDMKEEKDVKKDIKDVDLKDVKETPIAIGKAEAFADEAETIHNELDAFVADPTKSGKPDVYNKLFFTYQELLPGKKGPIEVDMTPEDVADKIDSNSILAPTWWMNIQLDNVKGVLFAPDFEFKGFLYLGQAPTRRVEWGSSHSYTTDVKDQKALEFMERLANANAHSKRKADEEYDPVTNGTHASPSKKPRVEATAIAPPPASSSSLG